MRISGGFFVISTGLWALNSGCSPSHRTNAIDSHIRGASAAEHGSRRSAPADSVPSSLSSGVFLQAIDHSGQLAGQTFSQRYWMDTEYAKPSPATAPVIFHICGEGDATDGYFLNDNAVAWAKELGANLVYLEHRYYGQSLPFSDLSSAHLQYLTMANEIADLANFQKFTSATQGWSGKWLVVGGSYSATLAALYRQKHPELVVGALAASAPMTSGVGDQVGDAGYVSEYSSTDPSDDSGERQWIYQSCTTFGFWMAEGADYNSTLDIPSQWVCSQLFGNAPYFNATAYNASYDQPFLANAPSAPSNILFTYGSEDVWTRIGLSQQTNANPNITILVIDGAGHHFDLNPPSPDDSAAVVSARAKFSALAKGWLSSTSN